MSNGYFNGQTRTSLKGGSGTRGNPQGSGGTSASFKEKPGFATGVPGKTQSKDRSGGVKRVKTSPKTEGL